MIAYQFSESEFFYIMPQVHQSTADFRLKMAAIEDLIKVYFLREKDNPKNPVFVSVKVTFIITVLKVVYWGL